LLSALFIGVDVLGDELLRILPVGLQYALGWYMEIFACADILPCDHWIIIHPLGFAMRGRHLDPKGMIIGVQVATPGA
jgi:hypothetical protein